MKEGLVWKRQGTLETLKKLLWWDGSEERRRLQNEAGEAGPHHEGLGSHIRNFLFYPFSNKRPLKGSLMGKMVFWILGGV